MISDLYLTPSFGVRGSNQSSSAQARLSQNLKFIKGSFSILPSLSKLGFNSGRLLRHLTAHEITSQIYAWPLMHTLFSEVISKDDFLILFDHIFFNSPGYYYYCVAAYVLCARGPLLAMSRKEDFQFFFHHRNSIPASQIIQKVRVLLKSTPKSES